MFERFAPSEIAAKLIGIGARRGNALLERSASPGFSPIAAVLPLSSAQIFMKPLLILATAGCLLFAGPAFAGYRVEDQRQALQLMVLMKNAPKPTTAAMREAHVAARGILLRLVSAHAEPSDHELLGICHVVLGDEASASDVFKAGLAIERVRDPQSKLCGTLMKRVSMV